MVIIPSLLPFVKCSIIFFPIRWIPGTTASKPLVYFHRFPEQKEKFLDIKENLQKKIKLGIALLKKCVTIQLYGFINL
jgi:hypothetical protein